MPTPPNQSLARGLAVLSAAGEGARTLAALAQATGLPQATVHRLVITLEAQDFLERPVRGTIIPGPALMQFAGGFGPHDRLAAIARPLIRRLAGRVRAPVQLAVLEGEMATYLVKEGEGSDALFSREGGQLEAYCSALGKVLLAALPAPERAAYLAGGPFPPLTARTITDPVLLAAELERTAARGYARDEGEVDVGLSCLAVPVPGGKAALSLSLRGGARPGERHCGMLRRCAAAIGRALPTES